MRHGPYNALSNSVPLLEMLEAVEVWMQRDEEADPERLKIGEDEVKSRRAIEEIERSKDGDRKEVPSRKGKSVVATAIRGPPLTEA